MGNDLDTANTAADVQCLAAGGVDNRLSRVIIDPLLVWTAVPRMSYDLCSADATLDINGLA